MALRALSGAGQELPMAEVKILMVLNLSGNPSGESVPVADIRKRRHVDRHRPRTTRLPGTTLLYERVVALVEQLIAEHGLGPGDLLPSYAELAEAAGVSLITVRRALDELERAGRVHRHQGLGTFVARQYSGKEPASTGSLLGALGRQDQPATQFVTRVLELSRGMPSAALGEALRIDPGSPVWRLRRLRLLDGEPAALETSVIPVALAPDLDALASPLQGSLYELLASQYRLVDSYQEQCLEVTAPTQEEAALLGLPAGSQVVRIRGLSLDRDGAPFDCFEQLYPAARFAFAISGIGRRQLLPMPRERDWGVCPPA